MRTIKFRAWIHNQRKMEYSENPPSFSFWKFVGYDSDDLKTLMQFTGIKDKNGKEIYEGDIVKYKFTLLGGVDEVIFRDGKFELKNDYVNEVGYRTVKNVSEYCEVIGNIYDNPELLPSN